MTTTDFKKYPDSEARTPRELFTARLRKICANISGAPRQAVSYKDEDRKPTGGLVIAKRLWVFGSYARGALTCGDLDLMLEVEGVASRGAILKAFIGTLPNVRTFFGTPELNATGHTMKEAVLVWAPGLDWEAALNSIVPDSSAGRFERPTDLVPFRPEQDGLTFRQREMLVNLQKEGLISWRFLPLSSLELHHEPERDTLMHCDEAWVMHCYSGRSESKKRLTPVVVGLARKLAQEKCPDARIEWGVGNKHIRVGGTIIQAGTLDLDLEELERYSATGIAYIPPLSTRGPNGVWLIERGPKLSLVKAFADVKAWVVKTPSGEIPLVYSRQYAVKSSTDEKGLRLYRTQAAAQLDAEYHFHDEDDPRRETMSCHAALIEGPELLEAIARADLVFPPYLPPTPLTYGGEAYLKGQPDPAKRPKLNELVRLFKSCFEPDGPEGLAA